MFKGRGREVHTTSIPGTPTLGLRTRAIKPEPDYEVVEFPSEQYVNAKLQPPPPPPPRPPTGHPTDTSCGLCGGGGARVRCLECGRRALCASCDDMYHRHPKRRNHQRQALPPSQLKEERPPLPPKGTPPVPPPRRHKIAGDRCTASPKPPIVDQRRATLNMGHGTTNQFNQVSTLPHNNFGIQRTPIPHQPTMSPNSHLGSMPNFGGPMHHSPIMQEPTTGMGGFNSWGRPRTSLPGYNIPPQGIMQPPQMEHWDGHENLSQNWGRPLRRGTSVMELGGVPPCSGCAHCATNSWRYGSCANLDHSWGQGQWPQACCAPQTHNPRLLPHSQIHPSQTPQPHRRVESRVVSRAASRANSRAPSPALSMRSRASRRTKHRTPTPSLPSSDADSESESESERDKDDKKEKTESDLGPAPPPPSAIWQCEHCTFVNEPGVRVCAVCCRTPTIKPKIIPATIKNSMEKLTITEKASTPSSVVGQVDLPNDSEQRRRKDRVVKERVSTGCGPSPPKDIKPVKKPIARLETPTKEHTESDTLHSRQDIAVGPSPPKDIQDNRIKQKINKSPIPNQVNLAIDERGQIKHNISRGSSPQSSNQITKTVIKEYEIQKKSVGCSPTREIVLTPESRSSRTKVSNTGTSPPPQNISTQTYEVPSNWERPSSAARSRPRRRFREERRERSQSRHSLSSDTRESERSIRTTGGRWEWRDSSPAAAEWSENERKRATSRLTRRASHLDLRRTRPSRRTSIYGSEAPSPEPLSNNRAISLEGLAGANSKRDAERGLELARLMTEAERLGFSAAEVHVALAQNPVAPLAWLTERWPSLIAGVRAAAIRLASGINVTELEARAALARHRGAMWPAVTECVERHRRQLGDFAISEEGKLRGRVWGSPVGVDDEAIPSSFYNRSHRSRADDSSDEFEETVNNLQNDDWMYLPLNINNNIPYDNPHQLFKETMKTSPVNNENIAEKLKLLLDLADIPSIEENVLLKGLTVENNIKKLKDNRRASVSPQPKENIMDFVQSEKDFIDAYNALTRLSPLPNIDLQAKNEEGQQSVKLKIVKHNIEQKAECSSNLPRPVSDMSNYNIQEQKDGDFIVKDIVIEPDEVENESKYKTLQKEIEYKADEIKSEDIVNFNLDKEKQGINLQDTKSNNLSDLVDTTQKLIQQMKDEINYDINSTQDSEHSDSSSNNSGPTISQESSYNETDNSSDELTSDENETSSSKELRNKAVVNDSKDVTTSSEDTEQFEEAIDYIEAPSDNLQESNIILLNSIARNLQNENTINIINAPNRSQELREDLNNNFFTIVNSFEEIYDQLNNENNEENTKSNLYKNSPINVNKNEHNSNQLQSQLIKETINMLNLKTETPIKQIVSEIKYPVANAVIENICEEKDLPSDIHLDENNLQSSSSQNNNLLSNENITEAIQIYSLTSESMLNSHENIKNVEGDKVEKSPSGTNITLSTEELNVMVEPKVTTDVHESVNEIIVVENLSGTLEEVRKEENKLKHTNLVKSNIPIPIKIPMTSKQKLNKSQTTIVSKLPVRRTSLKQYPAPAPPISQFGNTQNGHVKQLQTKLFNSKPDISEKNTPSNIIDIKPSTSYTLIKKKLAPQPPNATQSPPKVSSKNKEQFFRETCRTEDEWTDSESDVDIKPFNQKEATPTPEFQPHPPPTVRRISGQIIDLARIQLPQGSPERQARMLLAEGATENWDQARIAVELIARGTDAPTALLAALECTDLDSALAYINQYCELCAAHYPEHEMVSMLRCSHRCCRECAHHYFTVQITERSIVDCVCAYCKEPDLENLDEDAWVDYFAHLDILLKTLLETGVHELFQRKLRDRTLARDPNFRWCVECSSGFFVHPKHRKIRCPECKSVTCATCRKPWSTNHDGISCEQYATWLEDNDPERSMVAVQQHLKENGLECPRCHFKFSLSRGGCMHFTCTQCKYEFCYGCGKPFTMGARCGLSEYCAKLGLHAHHPRNCLFYLRDKEPHELQTLLQMNNVAYETEAPQGNNKRCPIQLQRETPTGLIDTTCGSEILPNNAGLCKMHYVEYLAGLARTLDPIPIMEVSELVAELRRRAMPLPERGPWDTDPIYAGMCAEIVKEKIPLD